MDKIIEALMKYLPGPVLGAFLAVGLAFFGVHHWRGFRDYGDTLRDASFLSLCTLIGAGLCLYLVNRPTPPSTSNSPLILVPYFENDVRDQYRIAFTSQLEQALEAGGAKQSIYSIPVFLAERESALQSAKRYGARAALFHPVIISGEKGVKICFHIAFTDSDATRPYAMVPIDIPDNILFDMANNVLSAAIATEPSNPRNPLLSRLDSLERKVESLRAALDEAASRALPAREAYPYRRKRAVVVGVNELSNAGFSLTYAISDAEAFSNLFETLDSRSQHSLEKMQRSVASSTRSRRCKRLAPRRI